MDQRVVTSLADHPESRDEIRLLTQESWPEFMLHSEALHWPMVFAEFPDYQLVVRAPSGELLGVGQAVPLTWDGTVEHLPADFDTAMARATMSLNAPRFSWATPIVTRVRTMRAAQTRM